MIRTDESSTSEDKQERNFHKTKNRTTLAAWTMCSVHLLYRGCKAVYGKWYLLLLFLVLVICTLITTSLLSNSMVSDNLRRQQTSVVAWKKVPATAAKGLLPTSSIMIGYFADSTIKYFPLNMEIYATYRQIELPEHDELEQMEHPKSSRDYRYGMADPMIEGDCIPMYKWQTSSFPSCNKLHEIDMLQFYSNDEREEVNIQLINAGYWRDVWIFHDGDEMRSPRVLKTLRYDHEWEERNYERHRRDAVAMERLSSSPYAVDIYGFCGNSGLFEYSDQGDIYRAIPPKESRDKNERNQLCSIDKLFIATQVALGIADMHNIDKEGEASIAHTDIDPSQFIKIGNIFKLNDFNRARFIKKNVKTGESCPYKVGSNPGPVSCLS